MHVDKGVIVRTYGYGWRPADRGPSTEQPATDDLVSLLADFPDFMVM
jgi:hypothetical protein